MSVCQLTVEATQIKILWSPAFSQGLIDERTIAQNNTKAFEKRFIADSLVQQK